MARITTSHHTMPEETTTADQFKKLVTITEMAATLNVHPKTLRIWTKKGLVPMIKVSGYCRFDPEQVWAALQQSAVK